MTNEEIKAIAVQSGFKLKEQPDGTMDLNPYVYGFARELTEKKDRQIQLLLELVREHQARIASLINKLAE